jgi:hypothetical protein
MTPMRLFDLLIGALFIGAGGSLYYKNRKRPDQKRSIRIAAILTVIGWAIVYGEFELRSYVNYLNELKRWKQQPSKGPPPVNPVWPP